MATNLTVFLLFFLPLVVVLNLPLAFETPKVILAEVIIETLLIIKFLGKDKLKFNRKQLILSLGLIGLTLVHLLFYSGFKSFFGNVFRLQGVFLLWHLVLFSLISPQIKLSRIPSSFYVLSLTGLLLSTFLFGQNRAGRVVGSLGEPNALAATAIFIFPFIVFTTKSNLVRLISLVIALIIVLISKSASGLIGLTVVTLFIFLTQVAKLSLKKVFLACLILVGLSLLLPFLKIEKRLDTTLTSPYKFEVRAEIWQTAAIAGLKSPIFGSGFGNLQEKLNLAAKDLNNNIQYVIVDSSHNFLLDFWVQAGVVGLGLILALLTFSTKNLLDSQKSLELAAMLGVLIVMLFNPVSIGILIAFWWLIGQGYSIIQKS